MFKALMSIAALGLFSTPALAQVIYAPTPTPAPRVDSSYDTMHAYALDLIDALSRPRYVVVIAPDGREIVGTMPAFPRRHIVRVVPRDVDRRDAADESPNYFRNSQSADQQPEETDSDIQLFTPKPREIDDRIIITPVSPPATRPATRPATQPVK